MRNGAFKAPGLRNVELTGPYFHTGSFLTLRQVVDFYFEGGDFPRTNASSRDPHVVDLERQAFAFGPTQGIFGGFDLLTPFDCSTAAPNDPEYPLLPGTGSNRCGSFSYLIGSFGDGLPDTAFLYDQYPDSNHPLTPEPIFSSRAAALTDAKNSIVKFLIALTDPRVKLELPPFDKPEIFVPIDGRAPENVAGRGVNPSALQPTTLISQSGVPCAVGLGGLPDGGVPGNVCFRRIPATGVLGLVGAGLAPLNGFLNVTNNPSANCTTEISHFCPANE
jgi:hypothetical protein